MGSKKNKPAKPGRRAAVSFGKHVGTRLRGLRQERGVSLGDLEAEGMRRSHVAGMQRGATAPTVRTLHELASALGVRPMDFVLEPDVSMRDQIADATRALDEDGLVVVLGVIDALLARRLQGARGLLAVPPSRRGGRWLDALLRLGRHGTRKSARRPAASE